MRQLTIPLRPALVTPYQRVPEADIEADVSTAAVETQEKGAGPGLGELVAETLILSPEDEKNALRTAQ